MTAPGSAGGAAPDRPRVADLPAGDRPRERLERFGAQALRRSELLAILLRTGATGEGVLDLAERLVREHGELRGLAQAEVAQLTAIRGLGRAKATTIAAAFELGRRLALESYGDRPVVARPDDIARLLQPELELLQQEELWVLVLDTKHHLLASRMVYRGTVDSAQVRIAELFRDAVRRTAPVIAIAHNHPSGDPAPSTADVHVTREIVEAGRLLEIDVLDHVVIGRGRWVSLRDRGLGFEEAEADRPRAAPPPRAAERAARAVRG